MNYFDIYNMVSDLQLISMCTNTELMDEYITSERTSGECKAIVIKRMAELGVDKNRFDFGS